MSVRVVPCVRQCMDDYLRGFIFVIQGEIQVGSWPMAVFVPLVSLNHICLFDNTAYF